MVVATLRSLANNQANKKVVAVARQRQVNPL